MSAAGNTQHTINAASVRQRTTRMLAMVDMAKALPVEPAELPADGESTDGADKLAAVLHCLHAELEALHLVASAGAAVPAAAVLPQSIAAAAAATHPATPAQPASVASRQAAPVDGVEGRLFLELQPVLAGLAMLTNTVRVLRDLQAGAEVWPELAVGLSKACPTWLDPFAHGDEKSADSVVCELARFAASQCERLVQAAAAGGEA